MTDNTIIQMGQITITQLTKAIPIVIGVFATFWGFKWIIRNVLQLGTSDSDDFLDYEYDKYQDPIYMDAEIERMSGVLGIGDYEPLYDTAVSEGYSGTFNEFKNDKQAVEAVYNS
jgi:hypothetical protein